ncbi:MAG: hypothetical protein P8165_09835 [Deltaproteobacteria bacterium]|jgi:3-oxoacyl-[acyl-carrier-protein] synthase II
MPFITGVGWITAGGMGRGRETPQFEMTAGKVRPVTRESVIEGAFAHFGRMDAFSKLGFGGIALALRDADLHDWKDKRPIGMIASTVYGCLQTDMDYADTMAHDEGRLASPALFSYTLPNCFLGEAAWYFGTTGLSYVIYDPEFGGLNSLRTALLHIRLNEFEKGVAGIVDDPPVVSGTACAMPGAAFVVIEAHTHSASRPYGRIELGQNHEIRFNDQRITHFTHLVKMCLNVLHGKDRGSN